MSYSWELHVWSKLVPKGWIFATIGQAEETHFPSKEAAGCEQLQCHHTRDKKKWLNLRGIDWLVTGVLAGHNICAMFLTAASRVTVNRWEVVGTSKPLIPCQSFMLLKEDLKGVSQGFFLMEWGNWWAFRVTRSGFTPGFPLVEVLIIWSWKLWGLLRIFQLCVCECVRRLGWVQR